MGEKRRQIGLVKKRMEVHAAMIDRMDQGNRTNCAGIEKSMDC
jgi:hypothetical protein